MVYVCSKQYSFINNSSVHNGNHSRNKYRVLSFWKDANFYNAKSNDLWETAKKHYINHKEEIIEYFALFICAIFITGMVSLLLKEVLQDAAGHLIPTTYLSLPILFSALALIAIFTCYLAIKPMKEHISAPNQDPWFLSRVGSFFVKILSSVAVATVIGYSFSLFYASLIPSFSFLGLSTHNSVIACFSIMGLFMQTVLYICSKDRVEDAYKFEQFFIGIFQGGEENSLRRIMSTSNIFIYNSLWAGIFTVVAFSALCYLPLGVIPSMSAAIFMSSLQAIIPISLVAQAVLSLFESAFASHKYGKSINLYNNFKVLTTEDLRKEEELSLIEKKEEKSDKPSRSSSPSSPTPRKRGQSL
jgi:hypothetical protein